jgi:tRNA(His) guanylyltransferase
MTPDEFEKRMRMLECFHALRFAPAAWLILRLDGRGFSRLTESRFEKPFDPRFHEAMVQTTQDVLEDLQGQYAYTESAARLDRPPRPRLSSANSSVGAGTSVPCCPLV